MTNKAKRESRSLMVVVALILLTLLYTAFLTGKLCAKGMAEANRHPSQAQIEAWLRGTNTAATARTVTLAAATATDTPLAQVELTLAQIKDMEAGK